MDDAVDNATGPVDDGDAADGDAGAWLDNLPPEQMAVLHEMLAAAERQVDEGHWVEFDVEDILARGRARRAARARAAAE